VTALRHRCLMNYGFIFGRWKRPLSSPVFQYDMHRVRFQEGGCWGWRWSARSESLNTRYHLSICLLGYEGLLLYLYPPYAFMYCAETRDLALSPKKHKRKQVTPVLPFRRYLFRVMPPVVFVVFLSPSTRIIHCVVVIVITYICPHRHIKCIKLKIIHKREPTEYFSDKSPSSGDVSTKEYSIYTSIIWI
jgi:hypothetical protein